MNAYHGALRAITKDPHDVFVAIVMSDLNGWRFAGAEGYSTDQFRPEFREEVYRDVFRMSPAFYDKWTA